MDRNPKSSTNARMDGKQSPLRAQFLSRFPSRILTRIPNVPVWASRFLRKAECSSGAAIVEFAVTIPLFLMLIVATFQFSIIMFNYESASFAVRQAARFGSTHSSTSLAPCTSAQVTAVAQSYLWSPSGSATVSVNWPSGNNVGDTIQVSVTESYSVALFNSTFNAVQITNSVEYAIMR